MSIPFNRPDVGAHELANIKAALESGKISGDGPFTKKCHELLEREYSATALLMHSCTAALEASVILANISPGDEVIMPSFTFVSTANAVVLRGGVPVFVDIDPQTLNIDPNAIRRAITKKTRAIIPVHYAGVAAEMDQIMAISKEHNLIVIEDAAQGLKATYKGKPLGGIGHFGCISFHETKNTISGEGGALLVNDRSCVDRALYIREKGTNRTAFLRNEVAKYEWIDVGSSYLPSDIIAALLLAQLQRADQTAERRRQLWGRYHSAFSAMKSNFIQLPAPPKHCAHNGHIYYLIVPTRDAWTRIIGGLKEDQISATSHYVPLHNSIAGKRYGRADNELTVTDRIASTIVRLPMFNSLSDDDIDRVIDRTIFHIRQAREMTGAA
jgi:dTDP-4-amino-4,6-dideoxygalactose transaminase